MLGQGPATPRPGVLCMWRASCPVVPQGVGRPAGCAAWVLRPRARSPAVEATVPLLLWDAPCCLMVHKVPSCLPALQVLALSATFAPEAKLRVQQLMHEPVHVEVDVEETVSLLGVRQFYRTVGGQDEGMSGSARPDLPSGR